MEQPSLVALREGSTRTSSAPSAVRLANCAGGMVKVTVLAVAAQLAAPEPAPKMLVASVTSSILTVRNLVEVPRLPRAVMVSVAPVEVGWMPVEVQVRGVEKE